MNFNNFIFSLSCFSFIVILTISLSRALSVGLSSVGYYVCFLSFRAPITTYPVEKQSFDTQPKICAVCQRMIFYSFFPAMLLGGGKFIFETNVPRVTNQIGASAIDGVV